MKFSNEMRKLLSPRQARIVPVTKMIMMPVASS